MASGASWRDFNTLADVKNGQAALLQLVSHLRPEDPGCHHLARVVLLASNANGDLRKLLLSTIVSLNLPLAAGVEEKVLEKALCFDSASSSSVVSTTHVNVDDLSSKIADQIASRINGGGGEVVAKESAGVMTPKKPKRKDGKTKKGSCNNADLDAVLKVLSSFIKTKLVCSSAELGLPGGLPQLFVTLARSFPGMDFKSVEFDKGNDAHKIFVEKAKCLVRGAKSATLKAVARTMEYLYPRLPKDDALWTEEPTVEESEAHQLAMDRQHLSPIRSQNDLDVVVEFVKNHRPETTDYELVAAVYYYVMHQANVADNQVMRRARVPFLASVDVDVSENAGAFVSVETLMVAIRDALFRHKRPLARAPVAAVLAAGK